MSTTGAQKTKENECDGRAHVVCGTDDRDGRDHQSVITMKLVFIARSIEWILINHEDNQPQAWSDTPGSCVSSERQKTSDSRNLGPRDRSIKNKRRGYIIIPTTPSKWEDAGNPFKRENVKGL